MLSSRNSPLGGSTLGLALGLAVACQGDPLERAAPGYHEAMLPLTADNRLLAEHFLALAGEIKEGKATPEHLQLQLREEVIPQAVDLSRSSRDIEVSEPRLVLLHDEISACWSTRASLYQDLGNAWEREDHEAFAERLESRRRNQEREALAFSRLAGLLAPYDLSIDPYAGPEP